MADESGDVEADVLALVKATVRQEMDLDFAKKVKVEYKGERTETRILALSAYRVYIVSNSKTAPKIESSFHILAIQTIESLKPLLCNITAAEKLYNIKVFQPKDCIEIIANIQAALKSSFPAGNPDRFRLSLGPSEEIETRLMKINNLVNTLRNTEADAEFGPCGGFSKVYACMCNYYGTQYLEEVAWDVDTIYLSHDTKEFNLQDFDHLDQKDLIPIISVLEYNSWFTKLVCRSFKLNSDVGEIIIRIIKKSTTLEELVLDGVSLGKEYFQKVALALTSNPKTALNTFDFPNNAMEDRGLSHLTGVLNKLQCIVSLSLNDNNLTGKSVQSLGNALKANKHAQNTLKRLNLSKNPLKPEGITALSEFLAQPNALTHLDLSYTDISLDLLFGALMRGCVQNLMHLNLAGNNFTARKKEITIQQSFQQPGTGRQVYIKFFSLAQDLKFVDLSNCKLPAESIRPLLTGFAENAVISDVELDISKNELKSSGAKALSECLHKIKNVRKLNISDNGFEGDFVNVIESLGKNESIQELHVGQNFKYRVSNVGIEALVQLISEENSHIHYLSLADSKLKQDLIPLLDALGTNETLTTLDISGNGIGDDGARILAKALQLNSKLRTLILDRNGITHRGYGDIAAALERNHTLHSIPFPLHDASQCLKAQGVSKCEQHLRKIEQILLRNQSPHKIVPEQAYRLQQGLLVASTQQQAVDRLIVQIQENIHALRTSEDEKIQKEISIAKQYIQDADKLKQLLLKFHLCTDDSDIEEEFTQLSVKFYQASQDKMKENVEKMLSCAREVCPYITSKEDVQSSLTTVTTSNQRLSQTFVEEVILTHAASTIINRISEDKLTLASIIADTIMDMVIRHMETCNVNLELLLKGYRQKQALNDECDQGPEKETDDAAVAARKAKNRLSSALLVAGDNTEEVPRSRKRRPTVSRQKPKNSISEENLEEKEEVHKDADVKKFEEVSVVIAKKEKGSPMVTKKGKAPTPPKISVEFDLNAVEKKDGGLNHLGKDRPRPAQGRRLPTRPSNRPQVTNGITKEKNEDEDNSIDHFWETPPPENEPKAKPKKEAKPPAKTPPRPAPKPAPKPKPVVKNTEESKKAGWIPKGGISLPGFFKKKRTSSGTEGSNDGMRSQWFTTSSTTDAKPEISPSVPYSATAKKTSPTTAKAKEAKKPPPPKPAPPKDRPTSVIPPKPPVKPRDRLATAPGSRPIARERTNPTTEGDNKAADKEAEKEAEKEEQVQEKPKFGPPKFGIGIGGMAGGGLLAEMKMRQERTSSFGKVPPETVPKPARRPSAEKGSEPRITRKTSNEDLAPVPRPRVPTAEREPGKINKEGLVRPSYIKRPEVTPPKPQVKPREKQEETEKKEKTEDEKKKEESKKEEPAKAAPEESVDAGKREEKTEAKEEKLKLKVKPDAADADLWVKRDAPSPKRSPKSNRPASPPPLDADKTSKTPTEKTPRTPTDHAPMSPLTRAATLPKPWSPSALSTNRSIPRTYSFDSDRKTDEKVNVEKKEETEEEKSKDVVETERNGDIKDEKKENKEEEKVSESRHTSVSPFHLPSRKGSSKETSNEKVIPFTTEDKLENEKHDDQMDEKLTKAESPKITKTTEKTTVSLAEEVKSHPLEDGESDPLHKDSLSVSSESDNETKKERPLSTHSDNTLL
ncbi:F-actin-uncapping protein LRRC16A-like isoform X3 [Actinia tenebrosa]|uniref:F-actin-uncapping protein LRRC16A-like isoform X3 n=1 Tax=Actinia tenebrosa TaxID=6105 RepID=A0A6P8I2E0_ACTTE|nr:F-actin-uncapping protein LRRC16A-like isoform X3 [Actinia tenebrosa]